MAESTTLNNIVQIQIINWKHYQHYKNRKPPWIKLHRELLDNQEWRNLSPEASKLLIDLWLIAADKGTDGNVEISLNKLLWCLRYASNMLASVISWLEEIKQQEFIDFDSKTLATCLQRATPETEKRREREQSREQSVENQEARKLATLLFDLMLKNDPKAKKPNLDKWTIDIDRLIRLDARSVIDVERVIRWCQADDFWHKNILSAIKLRKQFPQLWLKMNSSKKKSGRKPLANDRDLTPYLDRVIGPK